MRLTKAEKELVLEKRRQEEEQKPKKFGFLKEDLYVFDKELDVMEEYGWIFSKTKKNEIMKDFSNRFSLALKSGTEFTCYIDDNQEQWYDCDNYGIECQDKEWAEEYLIDIQPYIKAKL
jgi:hypothetical protein